MDGVKLRAMLHSVKLMFSHYKSINIQAILACILVKQMIERGPILPLLIRSQILKICEVLQEIRCNRLSDFQFHTVKLKLLL